jgi:NTE family protein
MKRKEQPGIGLAFSGGGMRGLAHIGVLKVLERQGIQPYCVAGSSMGGIIAAAYACGVSAFYLEAEALRMARLRQLLRLVDILPLRGGVISSQRVRAYFARILGGDHDFGDLPIPLALKAVDLDSGQEVTLHEGSVLDAMLATSAFPGLFPPLECSGRRLVDGGLLNNLPVDLVRQMGAKIVVAINVGASADYSLHSHQASAASLIPPFARNSYQAVMLMCSALTRERLADSPPDLMLHPRIPQGVGVFTGYRRAAEVIACGERAAQASLPWLRQLAAAQPRSAAPSAFTTADGAKAQLVWPTNTPEQAIPHERLHPHAALL